MVERGGSRLAAAPAGFPIFEPALDVTQLRVRRSLLALGERATLLLHPRHRHKYAVDAVLAAIANRQQGRTALFTSDVDDMGKLCAKRVQVRGL
ncbi:hypothetical protein ACIBQ3_16575 [Streptomyces rubiginosohelvolus]|uniref:hypothetical protein n=1 Tax=Streptomyces rubiginosohelvolus TaxID=67362 RepID=UPI0037873DC1